jgi:hypothetical protein
VHQGDALFHVASVARVRGSTADLEGPAGFESESLASG